MLFFSSKEVDTSSPGGRFRWGRARPYPKKGCCGESSSPGFAACALLDTVTGVGSLGPPQVRRRPSSLSRSDDDALGHCSPTTLLRRRRDGVVVLLPLAPPGRLCARRQLRERALAVCAREAWRFREAVATVSRRTRGAASGALLALPVPRWGCWCRRRLRRGAACHTRPSRSCRGGLMGRCPVRRWRDQAPRWGLPWLRRVQAAVLALAAQ